MDLSDDELRTLVRDAIARLQPIAAAARHDASMPMPIGPVSSHVSHLRLLLPKGVDGEGTCLIEPAVRCNQCGFCQSLGH